MSAGTVKVLSFVFISSLALISLKKTLIGNVLISNMSILSSLMKEKDKEIMIYCNKFVYKMLVNK